MGKKKKTYDPVHLTPRQYTAICSRNAGDEEEVEIVKDRETGVLLLQCPTCLTCVGYPKEKTQLYLSHRGSDPCKKAKRVLDLAQNEREVEEALQKQGLMLSTVQALAQARSDSASVSHQRGKKQKSSYLYLPPSMAMVERTAFLASGLMAAAMPPLGQQDPSTWDGRLAGRVVNRDCSDDPPWAQLEYLQVTRAQPKLTKDF
ncbi:hypothetical protein FA13DRAFT_1715282 [Coprinellus micaceus]|uniref:Uncharacterized protein n=1 Tax=Coprinellus micaceus TaxID=71717 RepID=A0A4Y7SP30_COPMI|nr:hypothetical protein FA13DRAFT_1715282 [Coprinellus micaceus]